MNQRKFELLLIDKVRSHDCLYNSSINEYKDKNRRHRAWIEIAEELNEPVLKCRDTWLTLRSSYIAYAKRRNEKIQLGIKQYKPSKWEYAGKMSFILPFVEIRKKRDLFSPYKKEPKTAYKWSEELLNEEGEELKTENEEVDFNSSSHIEEIITEEVVSEDMYDSLAESNKTSEKDFPEYDNVFQLKAASNEDESDQPQIETELDSSDMFFLSMGRIVKTFPIPVQAKVRMQICQIVSEIEIRVAKQNGDSS